MTLIELLASCGLVAFVIGLSVTPMIQMRKLEKKTEFQTALNTAHQIAVQKARNVTYLKQSLGLLPPAGSPAPASDAAETALERCFGGRGTGCNDIVKEDIFSFSQLHTYSTQSKITITATCQPTKCTKVSVQVATAKTTGEKDVDWRSGNALTASFEMPAIALASRQEIDFSKCTGINKVITGIDYETLVANCAPVTGNTTCSTVANAGPLSTVGQADANNPANCQPEPTQKCASGMQVFGLVGEPKCVDALACADPLSANCTPPPPAVCTPKWQPDVSTQCNGAAFTQIDANNCPSSAPRTAIGTNAGVCVAGSCSLSGTVKWPNPVTGPCGVASAAGTAAPGSAATIVNENLGYYGTLSATCQNNAPAANSFNMAGATSSCNPVVCTGVPASSEWSNTGLKSAVTGPGLDPAGPWACSGPQTLFGSPGPGQLNSVQADSTARAVANNTAAGPNGTLILTCNDPGPASAPRGGVLSTTTVNCKASTGYCLYQCVDNFMQTVDGRLEVGETSIESCKREKTRLTKFNMSCVGYDGATCDLTNPEGPMTSAVCSGNGSTPPTPPAPPSACAPGEIMGYSWFTEFQKSPNRVDWNVVGATNGFAASSLEAINDRNAICTAYNAQLPTKQLCGEFEPPAGPKCGTPSKGSLPNGGPPTPPPGPPKGGPCSVDYYYESTNRRDNLENVVLSSGESQSWSSTHVNVIDGDAVVVGTYPGTITVTCKP